MSAEAVGLPRSLGFELVRATEAAAMAAGRWMGMGERAAADRDAAAHMLAALAGVEMDGRVAFGDEGKAGPEALVVTGQPLGAGRGPAVDVLLDPVDGLDMLVHGYPGAVAAIAAAPRGTVWAPAPAVYMDKIVVGPDVAEALVPECLSAPAAWTLALVARVKGRRVRDLTVFVLDRPRHADLIREIRAAGARVMLRADGDIIGALRACLPGAGVDVLMGVGGTVEGLLAACAIRAVGGAMLVRLAPQSPAEREAVAAAGLDTRQVLTGADLVRSQSVYFVVTGITDTSVLKAVSFDEARAHTNSLILRGETRTQRLISANHLLPPAI
jgi:fructose-1,6-bisphosphatase II